MLSDVMATRRLTRQEKRELTRNAILRAASTLFARKGVEGTSMEEIARHAGLTQGAIYSNFKGKDDLWWAICDQITRTVDFEDFLTGERTLPEAFGEAGAAGARLLRDVPKTDLLLDQEFRLFLMRHPKAKARWVGEMRAADDEGGTRLEAIADERGESLPMPGERLALLMDIMSLGLIQMFMLDPDRIDEEFCADAFALLAGSGGTSRRPRGTAEGSSHRQAPGSRRRKSRAPRARA